MFHRGGGHYGPLYHELEAKEKVVPQKNFGIFEISIVQNENYILRNSLYKMSHPRRLRDITTPDITSPDVTTQTLHPRTLQPQTLQPEDITTPDITSPDITTPDVTTRGHYNPRHYIPKHYNPKPRCNV